MAKQIKEARAVYSVLQTVEAVYDGKALRTKTPLDLEPNTRVRITIETNPAKRGKRKSFLETARSLKIKGPSDLAENLDEYLYGGKNYGEG